MALQQAIRYEFTSPIFDGESQASPKVPFDRTGIWLSLSELSYDAGWLEFSANLGYHVGSSEWGAYLRPEEALSVCVEDAARGQGCSIPLIDPSKHLIRDEPNFSGLLIASDPNENTVAGFTRVSFKVQVPDPAFHPNVFVSASFRGHVSERVAVDLSQL